MKLVENYLVENIIDKLLVRNHIFHGVNVDEKFTR